MAAGQRMADLYRFGKRGNEAQPRMAPKRAHSVKKDIKATFSDGLPYQGPRSLIHDDDSDYNWDYQPPKHLHEQIKPHLDAHFKSYQATGRVRKHNGPPCFFLSGAWTGRSRSTNEFHRTLIECSKELENEELERRLRGAMVFYVDLENGTSPRENEMGNPIVRTLVQTSYIVR